MGISGVMILLVPFARCYALPLISNFKVGAVAQGATTGAVYFGANMEYVNAALSFTAFGPSDLGVAAALMTAQDQGLTISPPPTEAVVIAALAAANASYAPYSKGFAGVGWRQRAGPSTAGGTPRTPHSIRAFPLESALTMWSLGTGPGDPITSAVLVEAQSPADQVAVTRDVLSTLSALPLQVQYTAP